MTDEKHKAPDAKPQARRRRRRLARLLGRLALYASGAVVALLLATFLVLQTDMAQDRIRRWLLDTAGSTLRGQVRIGKVSGNLLFGLTLEDVALVQADEPLVSARRVSLSYLLPMLLAKVAFVNELQVDGLRLRISRLADGRWNIATLMPPGDQPAASTAPLPVSVLLNRIRISDAAVSLRESGDPAAETRQIENFQLTAGFELKPDARLSLRVLNFSFSATNPDVTLTALRGRFRYRPQQRQLNLDDVRIRTRASDISLNGLVTLQDPLPQFDLQAAARSLSLAEVGSALSIRELNSGSLSGTLAAKGDPGRFSPKIDLTFGGMSVSAGGQIAFSSGGALETDLRAKVRRLNLAALPLPALKTAATDLNFDLTVKGTDWNRPQREGRLTVELFPSTIAGYRLTAGILPAAVAGERLSLSNARLSSSVGSLLIHRAAADLFGNSPLGAISLEATIGELDPAALTGRPEWAGKINLTLNGSARLPNLAVDDQFRARAAIRLQPSRIFGVELESASLEAGWKNNRIDIQELFLSADIGQLQLSGTLAPQARSGRLQFDLNLPDLKSLLPLIGRWLPADGDRPPELDRLAGTLKLTGRLDGRLERPALAIRVDGARLQYGQFSADTLQGEGKWNGDLSQIVADLSAKAGKIAYDRILLPAAALDLALTPGQIGVSAALSHEKIKRLKLVGKVGAWRERIKTVTVDELEIVPSAAASEFYRFEPLKNLRPIRFRTDGHSLAVEACDLTAGAARVSVAGKLSSDGNVDSTMVLAGLELPRVASVWLAPDAIQGVLSGNVRLSGSLQAPFVTARLSVSEARAYRWPQLSNLDLAVDYRDGRASMSAAGTLDNRKVLDLNASVGLRLSLQPFGLELRQDPIDARLQLTGLMLSSLPIPLPEGLDFDGRIDLTVKAGGRLSAPDLGAELLLKDSRVRWSDPAVTYSFDKLTATLAYADSTARMTALASDREKPLLELGGRSALTLSLHPFRVEPKTDGFDFSARVRDLKLSALPLPKPKGIKFDGTLNLDARASGSLQRPLVAGQLSLKDGFLSLTDHQLTYESVTGDVAFSPDSLQIRALQVMGDTEGSLALNGRISLDGLKPAALDLKLSGDNVLVPFKPAAFARIQPMLALAGTLQAPSLTGNITVAESRLNVDLLSDQSPAEVQIDTTDPEKPIDIGLAEPRSAAAKWLDPLAADLLIDIPNNAWVKGQNINAEIDGQVNLRKSPGRPFILSGPLNLLRGNFNFQNRLFKVTRGLVDFTGQTEPDPNLDIKAETRIKKVKITVSVTGTAHNMIMALESEPEMDQTDIISYLVFGRPASELKGQQDFNAQRAALNFAGQVALKELKNILGDTAFIDTLSLETEDGNFRQGTVSIGKYVHPDVFVLYHHRFKADEPDEVEVVYEIDRNFSIETQLGNERTTGVDFVWEHDF